MKDARYSLLCQINTRVWLNELARRLGKPATVDDIPDGELNRRLRDGYARPVREHFLAGSGCQNKLARVLENHDEPRAAATFSPEVHKAAAVITFLSPWLSFFIRDNSRGENSASRPIGCSRRRTPSILGVKSSTTDCSMCCASRPCAVSYRGEWYWIDDDDKDLASKRLFFFYVPVYVNGDRRQARRTVDYCSGGLTQSAEIRAPMRDKSGHRFPRIRPHLFPQWRQGDPGGVWFAFPLQSAKARFGEPGHG